MKDGVELAKLFARFSAILVFIYLGISGLGCLWDIAKPWLHQITA